MITGQKAAAMPDQPKIITQNTWRSGETIAITTAMINAIIAMAKVTHLEMRVNSVSFNSGLNIF